ncbi:MAG: type II and III secretion system protein family protein [Terriglobia bacterium]
MNDRRPQSGLRLLKALATAGFLVELVLAPAQAFGARPPAAPGQVSAPQAIRPAPHGSTMPETLHLLVSRSMVINLPERVTRVSIANPSIADALMITPQEILVSGKSPGQVSVVIWKESGASQIFNISVDLDMGELAQRIRDIFPSENVKVSSARDVVTLSGDVSSKAVEKELMELTSALSSKVVDLMRVPATAINPEILLKVRFAEVDETAVRQLGANLMSLPGAKIIGTTSTQQFSPPQTLPQTGLTPAPALFTLGDLLNVFLFRPDLNLAATIQALEQKNLLQILAEPNLLTEVGKKASFLAGGEFPFPVVQGGTNYTSVTIQFKQFGVQLDFTPTLDPNGMIHLHVQPEVSSLDFSNALTISGFLVPALSTRRVDTEMDLRDGQSFAIAGLVDSQVTQSLEKIPGIGSIPVLGKLFQSKSVNKTKTELLVMVTPYLVKNGSMQPQPKFPVPFLQPSAPAMSKPSGQK